jgi:hypothetical protein
MHPLEMTVEKLNEMLEKVADAAIRHTPDAIELTGRIVQIQYAGDIVKGIVIILLFFGIQRLIMLKANPGSPEDREALFWITSSVAGIMNIVIFFDWVCKPLHWVAAFDPKMALAVKALELTGVSK